MNTNLSLTSPGEIGKFVSRISDSKFGDDSVITCHLLH